MSSRQEDVAGSGDVNPLRSDPELQLLLKKLNAIKKYRKFQGWKTKFLDRLEQFLYEAGMDPAEKACNDMDALLRTVVRMASKVQDFIDKGELSEHKKTVKSSLALKEMCNKLFAVISEMENLIPFSAQEEKKHGFTKFHVGAVLIRQGFPQYIHMKALEDALSAIGESVQHVADKQQLETFAAYKVRVQRFCDVMADLNLYEVMMKCLEFAEEPEDESEDPPEISIVIKASNGVTLKLDLDPAETIGNIKDAIADGCEIVPERQVLSFQGTELGDDHKTLDQLGIQDGSVLHVNPMKIPITVNTDDGRRIKLMIDPSEKMRDIKRQLEDQSGVPAENQKLSMNGVELVNDDNTADFYGIKKGSELELEPKSIRVTVEMPDGSKHAISIKPSDTGDKIKQLIADETGMDVPRQVLKFGGKEFGDKTARDMGVKDGSELKVDIFKVPVTVKTMDGKTIKVMVDPTDKLLYIKRQLEPESGVPANNQKLFLKDEELVDDNKTAADHGVKAGSVLYLEPKVIRVNVEMPDGKTETVEVKPTDTSDKIKEKIAQQTGMEAPRQVLKFNGKEFGTKTVKDMGITDGSTLTVDVFKVPIKVTTMEGKKIKVMIDPTDKLGDIKRQLEAESGLPASNQKLFMNGEELPDDKKAAKDYGIRANSELDLEPKSIKVTVEMPDGSSHDVDVKPSDTSDNIKAKIAETTGMAAPRQVVTLNGKELPHAPKTVRNMGIREGTKLKVGIFKIPITVETKDGKKLPLKVEPCDTIDTVKKLIHAEIGLEPKKQCLRFGEEELDKGRRTVTDCGIKTGSTLTVEPHMDPIIFVDIKCGTLFGMERDVVIERGALTMNQNNKLEFVEAVQDSASKEKIVQAMKASPTLGVATQVVVESMEVEDYDLEEAEKVKGLWGVSLKKREKNKKGEELFFVDPKTGAVGELSRKKYIDMKIITPILNSKGGEALMETEKDALTYDRYVAGIRGVFGIKSAN